LRFKPISCFGPLPRFKRLRTRLTPKRQIHRNTSRTLFFVAELIFQDILTNVHPLPTAPPFDSPHLEGDRSVAGWEQRNHSAKLLQLYRNYLSVVGPTTAARQTSAAEDEYRRDLVQETIAGGSSRISRSFSRSQRGKNCCLVRQIFGSLPSRHAVEKKHPCQKAGIWRRESRRLDQVTRKPRRFRVARLSVNIGGRRLRPRPAKSFHAANWHAELSDQNFAKLQTDLSRRNRATATCKDSLRRRCRRRMEIKSGAARMFMDAERFAKSKRFVICGSFRGCAHDFSFAGAPRKSSRRSARLFEISLTSSATGSSFA